MLNCMYPQRHSVVALPGRGRGHTTFVAGIAMIVEIYSGPTIAPRGRTRSEHLARRGHLDA
jgi:hypothetical protein